MFNLLFSLFTISVAFATTDYSSLFKEFQNTYNKTYSHNQDFNYRFQIFKDNLDLINNHNAQNLSWKLEMNEWSDLSWEEFRQFKTGYIPQKKTKLLSYNVENIKTDYPSSLDWVEKGVVTEVKNQGQCGSCWSFSATGAIESAYAIKTGQLISLSEQELVDCSSANMGCRGGLFDYAFEFVEKYGLCAETDYPYEAQNEDCSKSDCELRVKISSYKDVPKSNEDELLKALLKQPISVAVEADKTGFQFYKSGVFSGRCGTNLDHAILLVGYGEEDGIKYWKIKNSWGKNWGEDGYIKILRHGGHNIAGQCGIALSPSYPVV